MPTARLPTDRCNCVRFSIAIAIDCTPVFLYHTSHHRHRPIGPPPSTISSWPCMYVRSGKKMFVSKSARVRDVQSINVTTSNLFTFVLLLFHITYYARSALSAIIIIIIFYASTRSDIEMCLVAIKKFHYNLSVLLNRNAVCCVMCAV